MGANINKRIIDIIAHKTTHLSGIGKSIKCDDNGNQYSFDHDFSIDLDCFVAIKYFWNNNYEKRKKKNIQLACWQNAFRFPKTIIGLFIIFQWFFFSIWNNMICLNTAYKRFRNRKKNLNHSNRFLCDKYLLNYTRKKFIISICEKKSPLYLFIFLLNFISFSLSLSQTINN